MKTVTKEDMIIIFSHAMLTGLATNGHLLTANASGRDIGHMIREKVESIVEGFTEDDGAEGIE